MSKTIAILGSTGSVGRSTLRVIEAFPNEFRVRLLAGGTNKELLLQQARQFQPEFLAIGNPADAAWLKERLPSQTLAVGPAELEALAGECGAELTVSAIVGAAGLRPTMAAIRAGSHIGLANKESMVIAGAYMSQAARARGVEILPIDSEHNALHQCLRGEVHTEVKRLVLTASGGPFRTFQGDFSAIRPEQALKHPTWEMGRKITIDSATLMNKGLEVIEAHYLFDFPHDRISIVVHPQSIVHSMIETLDGSYKAQLGRTDMCDPIQYALTYPRRYPSPFGGFDLTAGAMLEFFPVDRERFPCAQLAYDALRLGDAGPTVLNAANEVAVYAFLEQEIRFTDIPRIIADGLEHLGSQQVGTFEDLLLLDHEARARAKSWIQART